MLVLFYKANVYIVYNYVKIKLGTVTYIFNEK
jgi:hypothetical protein